MPLTKYLNEILIFISGGGLIQIFSYFRDKRKDRTDEFKELLEYTKTMIADRDIKIVRLSTEYETCRDIIFELREELNDLKSKVIVLESAHFDIPFPMWLKSLDRKMISVNTEYENCFLKPMGKTAKDYINKTDTEIWGADVSAEFSYHDNMALNSKNGYWSGKEKIIINGEDITENWTMVKYVRYAGKTPIGIGGIAIPNMIK
jgi:hypothetical protein